MCVCYCPPGGASCRAATLPCLCFSACFLSCCNIATPLFLFICVFPGCLTSVFIRFYLFVFAGRVVVLRQIKKPPYARAGSLVAHLAEDGCRTSLFDLRLSPLSCYVWWSVCVACWIILWVCSVLCLYNRGRQAPGYFSWRISGRFSLSPKVKRRSIPTRPFWWQVFS